MAKLFKLILLVALIAAGIAGGIYYKETYMAQDYYTQISKDVVRTDLTADNGEVMNQAYTYKETAYNANGDSRQLEWHSFENKPLAVGTWVKVEASQKRTIDYKVVKAEAVPQKAKAALQR